MDDLKKNADEALERFVLGQMNDDELDAFLAHLALHPEAQAEVAAVRARIKSLRGATAAPAPPPSKNTGKWLVATLLFALLCGAGWWLFGPEPSPNIPPPPAIPAPAIPQQQPIAQTPPPPAAEQPKQLATAYRPNRYLETQISNLRSANLRLEVAEPRANQVLHLQSGKIDFQLVGSLKMSKTEANQGFRVLIFDNQPSHLEAMRFEAAFPIALSTPDKDGVHTFRLAHKIKLPPGLFYCIIEDESSGDWLWVGKFRVA
jgi:hypothetical protein